MKHKKEAIPGHAGIYRLLRWDKELQIWKEPKKSKFEAAKYINSKKVHRQFVSFKEAKAWHKAEPSKEIVASTSMTFGELVERWKKDHLTHQSIAWRIRAEKYDRHFTYFKKKKVEEIVPMDIDQWLAKIKEPAYLETQHSTRASYEKELDVLTGIFSFYRTRVNHKFASPILPGHRDLVVVRKKIKTQPDLSVEQYNSFLEALKELVYDTRFEPIYHIARYHYVIYGRIQDVAALAVEDFDIKNKVVIVNKKVIWIRAKGYEPYVEDGSKTDETGKRVPLTDFGVDVHREWLMRSGLRAGALFLIKGRIVSYRSIQYWYDKALKAAGLPFTGTHIIRHASLSEFQEVTGDIHLTMKMAGHSDVSTTQRYAKVRNESARKAAELMNDRLSKILG